MEVEAITGRILLDENPALKAEKAVVAGARGMRRDVEEQFGQAGKNGGTSFLKSINGALGKRSALGQITRLAAGGGAIGGLALVGHEFAEASSKIAEYADAMRNGTMATREFTNSILGSLPVFGGFYQTGHNIAEAFMGWEAEAKRTEAQVKALAKAHEDATKAIEAMKKAGDEAHAASAGRTRTAAEELALLKAAPGLESDLLKLRQEFDNTRNAANARADKAQFAAADALEKTKGTNIFGLPVAAGEDAIRAAEEAADQAQRARADANSEIAAAQGILDNKTNSARNAAAWDANNKDLTAPLKRWLAQQQVDAMMDHARPAAERMMQQLPSPILAAEELFGSKSVAGTGPAGYIDATKENTDATRENTKAFSQMESFLKAVPLSPTIAIMGGF